MLHVDLNQGLWISKTRLPPGFQVATHFHTGLVFAVTLKGSWHYLESPEAVNRPGSYLFEPAGSRHTLVTPADMEGMRSASEPYALLLARRVREKHGAEWGIAETGAAGPTGNRYGDAAGHSCIAVVGPGIERVITLETGSADRSANMRRFAQGAFGLAIKTIG